MIEPIARAEPLREAVYGRIVGLFWSGRYPPGTALTEAALARELGVSRTPVREALLRLQAEGVLDATLARGFTVRPLRVREAEELYPILAALESLAVRTATVPGDLGELERLLTELESCPDPVRRWQLDSAWHAGLVAASGNEQLIALVSRVRTSLSRYELTYMRETPVRADADRQHRAILAAFAAGDLPAAADLLTTHWHHGQSSIVTWLRNMS
ncbi:GntR family transcriptional regulator [Amycolatopsis anabasis]|uniref:GntR family transcriptional regulator n=1 Tax=Amycolatopsis anabasis TaxID=1840409 RepID=UPI00131CCB4F|nr:GntR family transcriptional regulator [Amycolatopsis anabasis]